MGYYTLADHQHRLVFFWNAKAGCTTIKHVFCEIVDGAPHVGDIHRHLGLRNRHRHFLPRDALEQLHDHTRVLVVRDPWTRLLSFYASKIVEGSRESWLDRYRTFDAAGLTFRELVERLRLLRPSCLQHHLEPQSAGLNGLSFDHVVPLEHLDQRLPGILAQHGIDAASLVSLRRHHNRSRFCEYFDADAADRSPTRLDPGRLPAAAGFYADPALARMVEHVYRADIDAFALRCPFGDKLGEGATRPPAATP